MSILIIGSIPTSNPNSIGGTTKLLKNMLVYLDNNNIRYQIIQTNKFSFKFSSFVNYIRTLLLVSILLPTNKTVMVHVAHRGMKYLAPVIYLYSKVWNKKFIIRKFGGSFKELYTEYGEITRYVIDKTFTGSSAVFFETKILVSYFNQKFNNVFWFPNVRERPLMAKKERRISKNVLFSFHMLNPQRE